jgi:hypothetical protein
LTVASVRQKKKKRQRKKNTNVFRFLSFVWRLFFTMKLEFFFFFKRMINSFSSSAIYYHFFWQFSSFSSCSIRLKIFGGWSTTLHYRQISATVALTICSKMEFNRRK